MARGSRPGEHRGGRKKGTRNKAVGKRADIAIKALESGLTPLGYMLQLLRDPIPETADAAEKARREALRFEAAKAAAPYVHPRLATHEISGKGGGSIPLEIRGSVNVVLPDNGRRNG